MLEPPSKKKKKGWGSLLGFGKRRSKKDDTCSVTSISQSGGSDLTIHSAPVPYTPTLRGQEPVKQQQKIQQIALAEQERSLLTPSVRGLPTQSENDDDVASNLSGYTGLSGISGKSLPNVSGTATVEKKKKKGVLAKLFGSSSKSKNLKSDGSLQLNSETLDHLNKHFSQSYMLKVENPVVPEVLEAAAVGTQEQHLEKMREETREDFLRLLHQVQQHFIENQRRDEALRRENVPNQSSSMDLNRILGNRGMRETSVLCDWTAADGSEARSGKQADLLKSAFILNKLKQLINSMFDEEGFQTVMKELLDEEVAQKRKWVGDGPGSLGKLVEGRIMLDRLNNRIENAKEFHQREIYQKVEILNNEINQLRNRLHQAVINAFDSYKKTRSESVIEPLLGSDKDKKQVSMKTTRGLLADEDNSSQPISSSPFLMPKFLQRATRLSNLWSEELSTHNNDYSSSTTCGATVSAAATHSVKPSGALESSMEQRKKDIENAVLLGLRTATRIKKAPVGEGFMVLSSRDDFLMMERKLDGKWGSYKIFEKWLQEALRWQWLDFQLQKDLVARDFDVRQLAETKKTQFLEAIDVRLAQLWMGRMTEIRGCATLGLFDLLEESITAKKPLFVSPRSVEMERARMELEDQRSHLERFAMSKLGRELFKQRQIEGREVATVSFKLKSADDMTRLIQDAQYIKYALLKDSSLVESLNMQAKFASQREQITKLKTELSIVAKEVDEGERKAIAQKKELDAEYENLLVLLRKEKEKQLGVESLRENVTNLGSRVADLAAELEATRSRTGRLESEKKQLKEERKKREAENEKWKKHLKLEDKKHEKLVREVQMEKTTDTKYDISITGMLKNWGRQDSSKKNLDVGTSVTSVLTDAPRYQQTEASEHSYAESSVSSFPTGLSDTESYVHGKTLSDGDRSSRRTSSGRNRKSMFQKMKKALIGSSGSTKRKQEKYPNVAPVELDSVKRRRDVHNLETKKFDSPLAAGGITDGNTSSSKIEDSFPSNRSPLFIEARVGASRQNSAHQQVQEKPLLSIDIPVPINDVSNDWNSSSTRHKMSAAMASKASPLHSPEEVSSCPQRLVTPIEVLPPSTLITPIGLSSEVRRDSSEKSFNDKSGRPLVEQTSETSVSPLELTRKEIPPPWMPIHLGDSESTTPFGVSVATDGENGTLSRLVAFKPEKKTLLSVSGVVPLEEGNDSNSDASSLGAASWASASSASFVDDDIGPLAIEEKKKKRGKKSFMSLFRGNKKPKNQNPLPNEHTAKEGRFAEYVSKKEIETVSSNFQPQHAKDRSVGIPATKEKRDSPSDVDIVKPRNGTELGEFSSSRRKDENKAVSMKTDAYFPARSLQKNVSQPLSGTIRDESIEIKGDEPSTTEGDVTEKKRRKSVFRKLADALSSTDKRHHGSELSAKDYRSTSQNNFAADRSPPSSPRINVTDSSSERNTSSSGAISFLSISTPSTEVFVPPSLSATVREFGVAGPSPAQPGSGILLASSSESTSIDQLPLDKDLHDEQGIKCLPPLPNSVTPDVFFQFPASASKNTTNESSTQVVFLPHQTNIETEQKLLPTGTLKDDEDDDEEEDDDEDDDDDSSAKPAGAFNKSIGGRRWSHQSVISVMDLPAAVSSSSDWSSSGSMAGSPSATNGGVGQSSLPTEFLALQLDSSQKNNREDRTLSNGVAEGPGIEAGLLYSHKYRHEKQQNIQGSQSSEPYSKDQLTLEEEKGGSSKSNLISNLPEERKWTENSYRQSPRFGICGQEDEYPKTFFENAENRKAEKNDSNEILIHDIVVEPTKHDDSFEEQTMKIPPGFPKLVSTESSTSSLQVPLKEKPGSEDDISASQFLTPRSRECSEERFVPFTIQVIAASSDDDSFTDNPVKSPAILFPVEAPSSPQKVVEQLDNTSRQQHFEQNNIIRGQKRIIPPQKQFSDDFPVSIQKSSDHRNVAVLSAPGTTISNQCDEQQSSDCHIFPLETPSQSNRKSFQNNDSQLLKVRYIPWSKRDVSKRVNQLPRDHFGHADLTEILATSLLSRSLTYENIKEISVSMEYVKLLENVTIFNPGDVVDTICVIHDGGVMIRDPESGAVLDRLGNGSLIFDREFLKGSVCVASATTSQPTTLYRMSRDFFAQTVQEKQEKLSREISLYFKQDSLFSTLLEDEAEELARLAVPQRYVANEEIITQGDRGDRFFILLNGSCSLTRRQERVTDQCYFGMIFGSEALEGEPYKESVTARSSGGVSVVTITTQQFESVVGDSHTFFQRTNTTSGRDLKCSVGSIDSISMNEEESVNLEYAKPKRKKPKVKSNLSKFFGRKSKSRKSSSQHIMTPEVDSV